jgi:hypothetical protein
VPFARNVDRLAKLPEATEARFLTGTEMAEAIHQQRCLLLTSRREIAAPVAMTENGDIENAAKVIDYVVRMDGGNAYSVSGYTWVPVVALGEWGRQLHVRFDTLACKAGVDDPPAPVIPQ